VEAVTSRGGGGAAAAAGFAAGEVATRGAVDFARCRLAVRPSSPTPRRG
jgi:hypothetical protein